MNRGGDGARTVADLVTRCLADYARRSPGTTAIEFDDKRLTYLELAARVEAVSRALRADGVGPETVVGCCVERGLDRVIALLAILCAEGACLPLDPADPIERLEFMVADAAGQLVVTAGELAARVAPTGTAIHLVGGGVAPAIQESALHHDKAPADASPLAGDSLAYIIYTSGSTGRPKGVAMPQAALTNLIDWQIRRAPTAARTLLFTAPTFDVSFQEILSTVATGGTLVEVPQAIRDDLEALAAVIVEARIERIFLPFVALNELATIWSTSGRFPRSLRQVITAGEQLLVTPAIETCFAETGATLENQYGPSETHIVSFEPLLGPPSRWPRRPAIGRAISDTELVVLDEELQPAPPGTTGEIYVAGTAVGRGYIGRPGQTAGRFVPDPRLGARGRMYRTGDLGRLLPVGVIEFLGRSDDQVKIRGYRVEPSEVELALLEHPSVAECAVITREVAATGIRLVAFYVPLGEAVTARNLREFLGHRLPSYMLPALFVALGHLPRTQSGKIDRRSLPPIERAPAHDRAGAAPATDLEYRICQFFADVVLVDSVSRDDDLLDIGGDSLAAARIAARLRTELGASISSRDVLDLRTATRLAGRVSGTSRVEVAAVRSSAPTLNEVGLSTSQRRIWLFEQLHPGTATYNVTFSIRLPHSTGAAEVRRALAEIVRRHHPLRSTFRPKGPDAVQVVAAPFEPEVPVTDLAMLVPEARPAGLAALEARVATAPFDLQQGPLLRTHLVHEEGRPVLLVCVHHLACDGWGIRIFRDELAILCRIFQGGGSSLPALRMSYLDYVPWERDYLTSPGVLSQLAYWRDRLDGIGTLSLPFAQSGAAALGSDAFEEPLEIGAALVGRLRELGRRHGTTLFTVVLAAFATVLHKYSDQTDLTIAVPIANRPHPDIEGLIGCFVNTVLVRIDLSGRPAFARLLRRIHDSLVEDISNGDAPIDQVIAQLDTQPYPARTSPASVACIYDAAGAEDTSLAALGEGRGLFDLVLALREQGTVLTGILQAKAELFGTATIRRVADHLRALLAAAADAPYDPIDELPMMAQDDLALIEGSAEPDRPERPRTTVVELMARCTAQAPTSVAVSGATGSLTYAELDMSARRLAATLRGLGAGPEALVGIYLERSPELVSAIFGVLKAGAAYLLLDPAYPAERLSSMVNDAAPLAIVTNQELLASAPVAGSVILTDELGGEEVAEPMELPDPQTLAYVVYTSGSTGQPKGVLVEHGALANLVLAEVEALCLEPGKRVLQGSASSFDAIAWEIFATLVSGAELRLLPPGGLQAGLPADLIQASGATVGFLLPSTLTSMNPAQITQVETLVTGGEACPRGLADRWSSGRTLVHVYGATEGTIVSAITRYDPESPGPSIGPAIPNARLYLLDRQLRHCPVGVTGELYIACVGVARGYLARAQLTADRFVPDPFARSPGQRMYRTGDLGYRLADGNIKFVGRVDSQAKIRGFRIEPEEVRAAVLSLTGVRDCIVVPVGEDLARKRLVAYVIPDGPFAEAEARTALEEVLPRHLVPSAIVPLAEFPLTPAGKTDVKALPEPQEADVTRTESTTTTEKQLAAIWEEVLDLKQPPLPGDDFFEVGGNSLLVMNMLTRLKEQLGVDLAIRRAFEAAKLSAMASEVDKLRDMT